MKGHDIAEQIRIGSLPREANGGEIGTCNFSAEAGVKESAKRSYSTVTLFARLRGGLPARCVSYITPARTAKTARAMGLDERQADEQLITHYCEFLSCASGEPLQR